MTKIARIVNGEIVYTTERAEISKPNETVARSRRESQRNKYRKETLQPNQTDYYKAYPDKLDNLSDGLKRQLS